MISRRVMPLAVAFLLCAPQGGAQSCPPRPVIVTVLDAHGLPISDLGPSNFKASSRGKAMNVLFSNFTNAPRTRSVVLLDTGASMGGRGAQGINKWKIARSAALEFLEAAPAQADVSLVTFSDKIEQTFKASDGRQPMEDWLKSAESLRASTLKGKAALHRTIIDATKTMERVHPGDAIYVITDGRNDKKFSMASSVAEELQSHGVRLFSFVLNDLRGLDLYGVDEGEHTVPAHNPGPQELDDIVRNSGGLGYAMYPGGERIGQSYGSVYDYDDHSVTITRVAANQIEIAISNFYILSVALPEDARGLEAWQLEVVDGQGKKRKDLTPAYPSRLPGCGGTGRH